MLAVGALLGSRARCGGGPGLSRRGRGRAARLLARRDSGRRPVPLANRGQLLGFVAAAWVVGRLAEAGWHRLRVATALSLVLGNLAIYAGGLAVLALYFPLERALGLGVYPFVVGDVLKIALVASVVFGQRTLGRG